ncbi:ATP-binding protein [Balneatrix alpica]|uniref:ATP-binding protein n=1 Tax=Balneatrix alpica TaxID=75684 RepID=UPI00273A57B6|nr:ATP-binding protein [Balneatrix alpica]
MLVGWWTDNPLLIQIRPDWAPMQFNTAVGFVFLSLGAVSLFSGWTRITACIAIALQMLGGLTLVEYALGINLGLDEAFWQQDAPIPTPHTGRMAANTALCFLLLGSYLLIRSTLRQVALIHILCWFLKMVVLSLSGFAFIGYLSGVEPAYGWGQFTRMAVHTSLGLILTTLTFMLWRFSHSSPMAATRRYLLGGVVMLVVMGTGLYVMQWFEWREKQHLHALRTAELVRAQEQLRFSVKERLDAFQRQLSRWEKHQSLPMLSADMQDYLSFFTNIHAIALYRLESESGQWIQRWQEQRPGLDQLSLPGSINHQQLAFAYSDLNSLQLYLLSTEREEALVFVLDWTNKELPSEYPTRLVKGLLPDFEETLTEEIYRLPINISGGGMFLPIMLEARFPRPPFDNEKLFVLAFFAFMGMALALALIVLMRQGILQRQLNITQESMPIGLVHCDDTGMVQWMNPAAKLLFSAAGGVKKPFINWMSLTAGEGSVFSSLVDALGKKAWHSRANVKDDQGENIPIEISRQVFEGVSGSRQLYTIVDRRKQTQLEEELIYQSQQFKHIMEAINEGVVGINKDGEIIFANTAACSWLQENTEDLLGRLWLDAVPHANTLGCKYGKDDSPVLLTLHDGITRNAEADIFQLNKGRYLEVDLAVSAIWQNQDQCGVVVVFSDIAMKKEHERLLRQHAAQLERINHELEEFNYIASHDLQESLRTMMSFCKLLEEDIGENLPEQAKKDMEFISDAAKRMQRLVQDLLAYSRAGRVQIHGQLVDLQDVFEEAVSNLTVSIKDVDAEIIKIDLPKVMGDYHALVRIFQNLIHNAIKYHGEEKPIIEILVRQVSMRRVEVGIKDNGIGIPAEYQEQIFGAFKRLHSAARYQGTGIGLAIVRKLVERMDGRVWVESEGKGSTFWLNLASSYDSSGEEYGVT